MIQLYNVHKRYADDVIALHDVTMRVREGEMVFLTGPSGAGKSTLIRLLLCMERAHEGQILIGGRNIHNLRDVSIPYLRRNFGVVFQDFRLIPRRDVFDNVAVGLEILGLPRHDIVRRVGQLLESLGLAHRAAAMPEQLSGGEAQRVALARALANEPAILLCDEPTGNLDPRLSQEMLALISDVNRRGATVVVATHDAALIDAHGARTLTLVGGRLVDDRPRRDEAEPAAIAASGAWQPAAAEAAEVSP